MATQTTAPDAVATPELTAPPSGAPRTEPVVLPDIAVSVSTEPFPIIASMPLRPSFAAADIALARGGVEGYLSWLNSYRDNGLTGLERLSGRFREAVIAGLRDSATPGVRRQFALESLRVDRLLMKPWGKPALAEVTATIVDRVVEGSGADQRETGRLRLTGDSLHVTDAWDFANSRWFNGVPPPVTADGVRRPVSDPIGFYLRMEQWLPGSPAETWRASEPTPFSAARAQRLASIDRAKVRSRLIGDVQATIVRFDTFGEIQSGIATVRLRGVIATVDDTGITAHTPFDRHVKVYLFGQWLPEVVDEEVASGVWLSGGDLALQSIDVNRA